MICRECEPTIDTAQRYPYRGIKVYDGNMQWLLLSVKIRKMISVWWFANKVTYHIDAERNPTASIVGRTSNNEERSYYKMEVSNNYSTAKLWGTSDKKVSKSSEKTKWKLTDSLKEKIVELAKKMHRTTYIWEMRL